jgi:hypothetical protein
MRRRTRDRWTTDDIDRAVKRQAFHHRAHLATALPFGLPQGAPEHTAAMQSTSSTAGLPDKPLKILLHFVRCTLNRCTRHPELQRTDKTDAS